MALHPYPTTMEKLTTASPKYALPSDPFNSSSISSSSSQTITTVTFGLCAFVIGLVTVWQSHKAWKIWHANYQHATPAQGKIQRGIAILGCSLP